MAKVDIELVESVLKNADIDMQTVAQIMEDLKFESKQKDPHTGKEARQKNQFVAIVNDPYGKIKETGFDYACWIVQIPEDDAPMKALERLHKSVYDFNTTPKGKRMPLKTVAEACEFCSQKIFKENKISIKTKVPVLMLTTNGRIPTEE